MNVTNFICQVCNKNKSNYTCPRCNAMYCTLQCYKIHDEKCTSEFYSSHVMDYIKNEKSSKKESIDMAKKLKKFYDQQVKDDEERDKMFYQEKLENQLLNENLNKLQKLALDNKININDLTQYQQQQFSKALKTGQLNKHINIWNPWWNEIQEKNNIILSEMDVSEENNINYIQSENKNISLIIPSLPIDIPTFESINAKKPSKLLPYLLTDILCSYVGAMIIYSGDWNDEPSHVLQLILSISCVLSDKQCIYNNFNELTNKLMERYVAQNVKNNKFEILLYLKQVCVLLKNRINVLRALNQMYELIQVVQSQIISKSKVSKLLNKKIKKKKIKNLNENNEKEKDINDSEMKDNYYDKHADHFMDIINIEKKSMKKGNKLKKNKNEKNKIMYSYSSSFAPEKIRKNIRKKCKKLDPIKRKIWYYLVWFNQYISNKQSDLLSDELKIIVQQINEKLIKIDEEIKIKMFN